MTALGVTVGLHQFAAAAAVLAAFGIVLVIRLTTEGESTCTDTI